jgi:hypothetical protein
MGSRKTLVKTKDILTKVSDDLGVSYEKVEVVYKIMVTYAISLTKREGIIAIRFPYIGVMYVKRGFLLRKLSSIKSGRYSEKDNGARTIKKIEDKLKCIDEAIQEKGYIYSAKRSISNNYFYHRGASLEERENKQNNYFYEGKNQ